MTPGTAVRPADQGLVTVRGRDQPGPGQRAIVPLELIRALIAFDSACTSL